MKKVNFTEHSTNKYIDEHWKEQQTKELFFPKQLFSALSIYINLKIEYVCSGYKNCLGKCNENSLWKILNGLLKV